MSSRKFYGGATTVKEVLYSTLVEIAEVQYPRVRAPEYGERAWRIRGKYADIVYWDLGNTWCDIINVFPKSGHERWVQWFLDRIWETNDE
jgi:hypothetical protein